MVIKDKVAAAVYVDATEGDVAKLDPASIELLVFTTGLLIDTLSIRKKTPSPSLNDSDVAAAPSPAPSRPTAPPPPPPRPTPPPAPVAEKSDDSTVAVSADQLREMMTPAAAKPAFTMPETDFGAPATGKQSTASFMTTAIPAIEPPRPVPPPPPPPPAAPVHEREERPSTQYIPPPNITRSGVPVAGPPSDDSKRHDEARRFARLLVSEIKLYNEPKVDAGRKNKDLYERLKEDIDRSRQMYDERIAEDVRKVSNYFYDELVRILADGHADALGL
jgi:hypothetical protein